MTMEITMATMGRLMKNFDIGYLSLTCRGLAGQTAGGSLSHLGAPSELLPPRLFLLDSARWR